VDVRDVDTAAHGGEVADRTAIVQAIVARFGDVGRHPHDRPLLGASPSSGYT